MIKNEWVEITIFKQNIQHYIKQGYQCKVGDIINVHYTHLLMKTKINIVVICDYCGKEFNMKCCDYFNRVINGIIKLCSCKECKGIKTKQSNLVKYGTENVMQVKEFKENLKQTMIEKYGVEHPMHLEKSVEKSKQTQLIRYGVDNVNKLKSIREKIKKTTLEKYGVEYYTQTEEYLIKKKNTCQKKYGFDNAFKSKEIQDKQRNTVNNRFNCDNVFQNEDIKEKLRNTMLKKYGVKNPMQVIEIKNKVIKSGLKTKYKNGTAPCSQQQLYICNLLNGELNYPVDRLSLDIAFPEEKIYVEYNGGGHDIDVKYGKISERKFILKEIKRYKYLKSLGWKQILIISLKDLLPSDEIIVNEIQKGKDLLKLNNKNHYRIEINESNYSDLRKIKKLPQLTQIKIEEPVTTTRSSPVAI